MLLERIQFGLCATILILCCLSIQSSAQDAQAQQLPQAAPPAQLDPLPLTQQPPGPIIVSYQNGQLRIEALNSTLSSVLQAACYQTGTAVEIPTDAEERVVGFFGPASAREVFASLLNGSRFNYLMVGSPDDARMILRLTLFVKPTDPPTTQPVRPAPQLVAKAAEPPPVRQSPQQAKQPPAEPKAADQPAPQLPRRRYRRR